MKEYTDYSLLAHNTFGMDVRAAYFTEYDSIEDLQKLIGRLIKDGLSFPWFHLGGGSNVLFLKIIGE